MDEESEAMQLGLIARWTVLEGLLARLPVPISLGTAMPPGTERENRGRLLDLIFDQPEAGEIREVLYQLLLDWLIALELGALHASAEDETARGYFAECIHYKFQQMDGKGLIVTGWLDGSLERPNRE